MAPAQLTGLRSAAEKNDRLAHSCAGSVPSWTNSRSPIAAICLFTSQLRSCVESARDPYFRRFNTRRCPTTERIGYGSLQCFISLNREAEFTGWLTVSEENFSGPV